MKAKQITALLMTLALAAPLTACGGKDSKPTQESMESVENSSGNVAERFDELTDEDGTSAAESAEAEASTEESGIAAESTEAEAPPEESEVTAESTTPPAAPGEPSYSFAEGVLTISGGGAVTGFHDSSVSEGWTDIVATATFETDTDAINASVQKVVIEEGITEITRGAFSGCSNLTEVVLPGTLTSIGAGAFQGCGLTSLDIPESVTSIAWGAFSGCGSLTSVTLPSGITEIQELMFADCTSLSSIQIPAGVTAIGGKAFYNCALTEVTLPDGLVSFARDVFYGCPMTELTIPASVTEIDAVVQYDYGKSLGVTDYTFEGDFTIDQVVIALEEVLYLSFERPVTVRTHSGTVIEGWLNKQRDKLQSEISMESQLTIITF